MDCNAAAIKREMGQRSRLEEDSPDGHKQKKANRAPGKDCRQVLKAGRKEREGVLRSAR